MKLTQILVPLDGSSLAEVALPNAVELAQTSGAQLLLLRAPEAPVELPLSKDGSGTGGQ